MKVTLVYRKKVRHETPLRAEKTFPVIFTSETITFMICVLPESLLLVYTLSSGC